MSHHVANQKAFYWSPVLHSRFLFLFQLIYVYYYACFLLIYMQFGAGIMLSNYFLRINFIVQESYAHYHCTSRMLILFIHI